MSIFNYITSLLDFSLTDTTVAPVENRRRHKPESTELTFDKLFNRDTNKFNINQQNNNRKYTKIEEEPFIQKLPKRQQISNPNGKIQNGIGRNNGGQRRHSSHPSPLQHDNMNRR